MKIPKGARMSTNVVDRRTNRPTEVHAGYALPPVLGMQPGPTKKTALGQTITKPKPRPKAMSTASRPKPRPGPKK